MAVNKIDDTQLESEKRYHICQKDVPDKTASEMKTFMDYVPRNVIIPKINEMIDDSALKAYRKDVYDKSEMEELLNGKTGFEEVYTREELDIFLRQKADTNNVYEKGDAERTFSAALKGYAYGKTITIDDAISTNHALSLNLVSKNRIPSGYASKTVDGVTFNVASDGRVTLNGTSTKTSDIKYALTELIPFEAGTYFLSGCPVGGSTDKYWLAVINSNGSKYSLYKTETGEGFLLELEKPESLKFYIRVAPGTTVENIVFEPMFEKSNQKTEYTQYVSNFSKYYTFVDFYQDDVFLRGYCSTSDRFGRVDSVATESTEIKIEVNGDDVAVSVEYIKDLNKTIDKILRAIS